MKKIISILLTISIFMPTLTSFATVGDSGIYNDFEYTVTGDTTVSISKYVGNETEVTVPQKIGDYTVTSIGNTAFQEKKNIVKITLPETIKSIDDYNVFWYCSSLKTINLPKGLTYLSAGAFTGCSSLEKIVIPDGITKLSKTFRGCTSLKTVVIPDSVTSIDRDAFYTSAFYGTTLMKNVTIYCNEGSFAEQFAKDNGINYVALKPKTEIPYPESFQIEQREVTVTDNKAKINIRLKNVNFAGDCTAYAALYKKDYSDGETSELYAVSSQSITIEAGETAELPAFEFTKEYKDNLTYKILILDDEMTPLLNTVERAVADQNEDIENYPTMNLFESTSSNSSWDKAITSGNFAVSGWANLAIIDDFNYLPTEAYRSFPEIVDRTVTLDFDFSMDRFMDDTRFSILNNEDVIVGFITKDTHLYLEQSGGELIQLAEYAPYTSSDEEAKTYVRTEFDLEKRKINYVRVNGDVVAQNLPLTKSSNRIDGFDVLTGVTAEGRVINRQVRINCDYIINEYFDNQFGISPKDWSYELNGSKTSAYEINSRVPDRFSINVDTTDGDFKAVKSFDKVSGNPVFEIMTLQPQKRDGLKFSLKNGTKPVIEISADGTSFILKAGEKTYKMYDYQANVWYGLKAEVDLVNSKADIYVNNKKMLSGIDIDIADYAIDNIEIIASKNSKNFIYDDVRLYKNRIIPDDYVPEPEKPEKDDNYVMGMQVCNLWTEGQFNKTWDYIKSAPNRLPVFGPYDEGNPEMNDWEIKWLAEHGIDYELIWAYPNIKYSTSKGYTPIKPNIVREGHYIYDGFMNAEYSDKMNFAISFENDSANYGPEFYNEFFEVCVPYWIEYYMKDARYQRVDGRPIFGVYVMDKFLNIFGTMGVDDAKINQGIARFRQMCIDAGVGNPYIISHGYGYTEATFQKYSVYDIDCIGLATWPKHEGLAWQKSDIKNMAKMGEKYDMDFVTTVQPRVDLAAWEERTGFHSSGEAFSDLLEWTRDELPTLITNSSLSKNLMTLLTWNEFGEGHLFMPTQEDGFTYLDCVRDVFVGEGEHRDVVPEGEQVKRINRMVDNDRLVTTVRENPLPCYPENVSDLTVKKGWYFTSAADVADWEAGTSVSISQKNGKMVVSTTSNEPEIILSDVSDMDLYDVTYVKIRMKGNTSSCGGNVKWTTDKDTAFDDVKRTYFESPTSTASTVHDYYAPIGQSVKRAGKLTGFKITPGLILDKTQKFEIESIELLADKNISDGTKLVCGDTLIHTLNEPVYKNGTLMVPLREVADSIGAKVNWYGHNNSYVLYDTYRLAITFKTGETVAMRGNIPFELPQAPYSLSEKINDTVYVPVNLIEEGLKVKVEWNAATKTLTTYTDSKVVDMPDGCEIVRVDYFNDVNYTANRFNLYNVTRTLKGDNVRTSSSLSYNANILYKTYFAGVATKDVDYICIKMHSSVDATMRVFFSLGNSTVMSTATSSNPYAVEQGENIICIPVSELNGWTDNTLKYLRIDPLSVNGEFEIDYVALVKKN